MRYIVCTFILTLLLSACDRIKIPVEKGISEELARQRKAAISNISYDLSFTIPGKISERVNGTETLVFDLANTKSDLQLDFKGDTTAQYTLTANGNQFETSIQNGHLIVHKKYLHSGKNELQLSFACPDWSLNRNPEFLYTLFVPDRASTAFPCFDQPDLKAQFKLHLTIPEEWKAVANGSCEKEEVSNTAKSLDFKLTKPLPTYLFAFTAGKFDTISRSKNGKTCVLYHREKEEELHNNADSIFSLVFSSLKWIENYTGIPYPFEKYDLVAVPSFQYSGMEHPGATFYKASSLFPDKNPTQQQLLKRANLIAHETAHMWFGDLVTMPWFNEVWMKEVFANFMADKVVTPMFPQFNFDLQFLLAHYDAAYSVDRTSGANAIGQKLGNMKDAGSLYGSIIYHKAPIVMLMLEQKTGENALQKGLQQYLSKYAYSNAGWKELIEILNTTQTDELPNWSASWVNEAGRPELKSRIEGENLIIEQHDPYAKNRIWPMEFDYAFAVNGQIKLQKVALSSPLTKVKNIVQETRPEWVYLNPKGNTYGFVELDPASISYFFEHFSDLEDDLMRASLLTDLTENLHEKKVDPVNYLKFLIRQLPLENNPLIFEQILSDLESCCLYIIAPEQLATVQEELENTLWKEYRVRQNQRTAIIANIIKIAKTKSSLTKLEECLNNPARHPDITLNIDQQIGLAYQLALKLPEKAIQILDEQENRITNPDKKAQFRFVRKSLNPDKAERDRFFESLLQEENREHEPWVDQTMAFLNHPERQADAVKYIRPALDKLQEIQRTGDIFFPKSWLDNLLKGHSSPEASAVVKQFLNDHPHYPENLKMKILQSADHLLRR